MEDALDLELKRLLVGTNEQRRRVGQAVFHLYRTFVFWHDKGQGFYAVARHWAAAGAAIFDSLASRLRELEVFEEDRPLRAWLAEVLDQLGQDLERGESMLHPFIRWLETRFPDLTQMMQEEKAGSRIHDYELARALTTVFARARDADRDDLIALLRGAAFEIK